MITKASHIPHQDAHANPYFKPVIVKTRFISLNRMLDNPPPPAIFDPRESIQSSRFYEPISRQDTERDSVEKGDKRTAATTTPPSTFPLREELPMVPETNGMLERDISKQQDM